MNKVFIFLIFIYVYKSQTEALDRILLRKYVYENSKDSNSGPDSNVLQGSLVIEAHVIRGLFDQSVYNISLDTTTNGFWVISTKCDSKFCRGKTSKGLDPFVGTAASVDNKVRGWLSLYDVRIGAYDARNAEVLVADNVWPMYGDKINHHSYGALGLMNTPLFKQFFTTTDEVISIVSSGKHSGLYFGIPDIVVFQNSSHIFSLSKNFWKIHVDYISNKFGKWQIWCQLGCQAVIDSNFNGISGPMNEINSINSYLGADKNGNIKCSKKRTLQPLVIHINGKQYNLDPKNYITKGRDQFSSTCKTVFIAEPTYNNVWRLGLPLFDQYLVAFDFNSGSMSWMELNSNA